MHKLPGPHHTLLALVFLLSTLNSSRALELFTDPHAYEKRVEQLGMAQRVDFDELDSRPLTNNAIDHDAFDGRHFLSQGIRFGSEVGLPLFVAPGGLFWNESNSLAIGRYPFDGSPLDFFPGAPSAIQIQLEPSVVAIGFTIVDNAPVRQDESISFIGLNGDLLGTFSFPENLSTYRSFIGVVSNDQLIKEVRVKQPFPTHSDTLAYDDIVFLQPTGPFVAYNDLSWARGQLAENITRYTSDNGPGNPPEGSTGSLIDFEKGVPVAATLTVEGGLWNGENHTRQGLLSREGTDAYGVFNGKVDGRGVVSYNEEPLSLTFGDLDPNLRYEVILFGNRDREDYTDRLTKVTLSGAVHMENRSSEGARFTGKNDECTILVNGFNTKEGRIARFSNIHPGEDGVFALTVSDGGSPSFPKFYASALCLRATPSNGGYVTQIGFSNAADGDKDVTEFLVGETLHVFVRDVDMDPVLSPEARVDVTLIQRQADANATLAFQEERNAFVGQIHLGDFRVGEVEIILSGSLGSEEILRRNSSIFIRSE